MRCGCRYIRAMARVARIVVPGALHHITQRGNNRQDVFFVDDDRRVYLELLRQQSERYGFVVEGYCLMTNHVHVVGRPGEEVSLAKAIGRTHFLYTQYVNRLHGRNGHLWQNRFFSCAMDEGHGWNALAYVELNPVRAGIVRRAWRYPWSSSPAHCGIRDDDPLLEVTRWHEHTPAAQWKLTLLDIAGDEDEQRAVRTNTHTGRPLGSDRFLSKLEKTLGRRVRALPVGRQKGWKKNR